MIAQGGKELVVSAKSYQLRKVGDQAQNNEQRVTEESVSGETN